MPRPSASYSAAGPQAGPALFGVGLVAVLVAVLVGFGAGPAAAAPLQPCQAKPTGPVVEKEGEFTLAPKRSTRRAWKRSRVRQKLIRPANRFTGRPTFPVKRVRYSRTAKLRFKGGLKIVRKRRAVKIRKLRVLTAPGKPALLRGKAGKRTINFLRVKGGKRKFKRKTGELIRFGNARLTRAGAKLLNDRLRTGRKRLRAGMVWGYMNLYTLYRVIENDDPASEVPPEPPVKSEPAGTRSLTSASIEWYVRDSFIEYIATGQGTRAEDGAVAGPPSGPGNLVYSYNFPFASGWTVPESGGTPENALVKGNGTVGFRYCQNTVNFTASDPEIELDGDENSRLIFRVNGTDGTPFPDQRAVMVKLIPGRAESRSEVDNGDGTTTVTYTKIPGFVPAEGTGIFANFYDPFNPDFEGQDPRPDRFGFLTVTYTYSTDGT